jgi:uncharacterized protein YjbJ (UPF0337 family)
MVTGISLADIHLAAVAHLECGACNFRRFDRRIVKVMGAPNKDEIEGKFDQAKGSVKEGVGRAIDDEEMEAEGSADRAGGKLQEGYGEAKRKVGDAIKDVGDAIRK